jgi:hypothetical protein
MLDIHVTIEGDKVVIHNLEQLSANLPKVIDRGVTRIGAGVFGAVQYWLMGPGGASKKVRTDYVGFEKKSGEKVTFRSYEGAGGYPVPIRTKGLLDHLAWVAPGQSKSGSAGAVTAGPGESIVFNSAEYARTIREGTGSSAKFGPRDYLTDGFERFNQGARSVQIMEEEIAKEVAHHGQ